MASFAIIEQSSFVCLNYPRIFYNIKQDTLVIAKFCKIYITLLLVCTVNMLAKWVEIHF